MDQGALRRVDDLKLDPSNLRQRTARSRDMIVRSLKEVGTGRSIVIDEKDIVLAGNGVVDAAAEAGVRDVRIIDVKGTELVAIRRTGLTAKQKRALAIYDNRTAELSVWDTARLAIELKKGAELAPWFDEDELAAMLSRTAKPGKTDPDATPKPRRTSIKRGDVFQLGDHRLICGDATNKDDVAKLLGKAVPDMMVTDPPYGVAYDPTWRAKAGINKNKKKMGAVRNDTRADWTDAWKLFRGVVAYVWHGGLKSAVVQTSLERADFAVRSQIIWAKDRLVLSRGDYHWQHEPCWYAVRAKGTARRTDDRRESTLWEVSSTLWRIPARDDDGHGHSTQKPVECMARAIRNHQFLEVYEPFAGSGTTLIACEQLGRRCYASEIDPQYVQVAIDRWEGFTGEKAVKLGGKK